MLRIGLLALFSLQLILLISCQDEEPPQPDPQRLNLRAADLSFLPRLEEAGILLEDEWGRKMPVLRIFQENGANAIRLRLWHDPPSGHSTLDEVRTLAPRIKSLGMQVWLTLHYADSWADPGQQPTPEAWRGLSVEALADSVYHYTRRVVEEVEPDLVQIGNEINNGLLWPQGRQPENHNTFRQLLQAGIKAVRDARPATQIMLHYAGHEAALGFFAQLDDLDYDLIGLSYYPWWHGKNLKTLEVKLKALRASFRPVVLAEVAYPFTLDWYDQTHNNIGLEEQLILPEFPASPEGQAAYLQRIREICIDSEAEGFCYWAPDWVAYRGPESQEGSSWENLALFDFQHRLLPAIDAFNP